MTCIIGILDQGKVYIGGDSAGVSNLSVTVRADEKVFTNGEFIMGFTSSFRMGQLLRYKFDPPKKSRSQTDMQYMTTSFIDAVRKCFKENGFGNESVGGNFLVAYNNKLYNIDTDYQVGIPLNNYDAIGCGSEIALGSLYATAGMNPQERITKALDAATEFNAGVRPPFLILPSIEQSPKSNKVTKISRVKKRSRQT